MPRSVRTYGIALVWCGALAAMLHGQTRPDQIPDIVRQENSGWRERLAAPYRAAYVPPIDFSNSSRIDSLLRAGKLYLSLQDAIALAIENNLDVELQRFAPRVAQTDVLRAQGGGLLRGVPFITRQLPQGVGGPGAPLLTAVRGAAPSTTVPSNSADLAIITEGTTDLSVLGAAPLSTGPFIPQFDPTLTGQINWAHQTTPQVNALVTGTNTLVSNNATGGFGYQQGLSTGTLFNAGYSVNRFNTNATQSNLNPYSTANLGVTVTQPLLQGFNIGVNRRFIRIAKNDERIADYVFEQQTIDTVANVIRLYWDLVSLVGDVRVKQEALGASRKLYEDNKSQVEVGTLAPLELKRAQAEVARSRQDLTNSESLVLQQELLLKTVLTRTGSNDPRLREARIVPLDSIQVPEQEAILPVQDLIAEAVDHRPDLAGARVQIDNSQISLKGSRNELLPQLNVVGSLQNSGLAGNPNALASPNPITGITPTPSPYFVGGTGTLFNQIFTRGLPNYGIGVQLNIPLRNRVAQADVIRDELQVRQSEVRVRQLGNQIRLEVENALIALQRARASYDAAVETRQLQEEALAAEQERYTVGASTSFFVIQYQRDLAQARSTEVITQGNYAKAKAALGRALGMTLVENNVVIEEALHGRISRAPTPLPVLDGK